MYDRAPSENATVVRPAPGGAGDAGQRPIHALGQSGANLAPHGDTRFKGRPHSLDLPAPPAVPLPPGIASAPNTGGAPAALCQ